MKKSSVGIIKQNQVSVFAWPDNDLSQDIEFLGGVSQNAIQGISQSLGDNEALYAPSLNVMGGSELVDYSESAPEPWESEFIERLQSYGKNYIFRMKEMGCRVNFLFGYGLCGSPGDIDAHNFALLAEEARLNELEISESQTFESQRSPVEITGTLSGTQVNRVLKLILERVNASDTTREVTDVVYADDFSCGHCAPTSEGCNRIFATVEGDTTATPAKLLYRVKKSDGTWHSGTVSITAWGNSGTPAEMASMGKYLVMVEQTNEAHIYTDKTAFTPAGAGTLYEVSTGYVATKGPRCITVLNAVRAYIGGAGGYIYLLTNPTGAPVVSHAGTLATDQVNTIDHYGDAVLAGLNTNKLLLLPSAGSSWQLITGPVVGAHVTALYMRSLTSWEVGMSDGTYWITADGGDSWSQRVLPAQGTITGIAKIRYSSVSDEVGLMIVNTASTGYPLLTVCGGRRWTNGGNRFEMPSTLPAALNSGSLCGINALSLAGVHATTVGTVITGYNN